MDEPDSGDEAATAVDPAALKHRAVLRVPFASERAAVMAMRSLEVDTEISPEKVRRELRVEPGGVLVATVDATEARMLRASLASLMDMMAVTVRVLCEFDPGRAAPGAATGQSRA